MDVVAVGDDAAPQAAMVERRADDARGAVLELRHRVEEVRDAARARVGGRHDGLVARIGMAER